MELPALGKIFPSSPRDVFARLHLSVMCLKVTSHIKSDMELLKTAASQHVYHFKYWGEHCCTILSEISWDTFMFWLRVGRQERKFPSLGMTLKLGIACTCWEFKMDKTRWELWLQVVVDLWSQLDWNFSCYVMQLLSKSWPDFMSIFYCGC